MHWSVVHYCLADLPGNEKQQTTYHGCWYLNERACYDEFECRKTYPNFTLMEFRGDRFKIKAVYMQ